MKTKLSASIDIGLLLQTQVFRADIANICNEAALIAARKTKKHQPRTSAMPLTALWVDSKKNKVIGPKEKSHCFTTKPAMLRFLGCSDTPARPIEGYHYSTRSIFGRRLFLPENWQITTTRQLMDEMARRSEGRAAEFVVCGK